MSRRALTIFMLAALGLVPASLPARAAGEVVMAAGADSTPGPAAAAIAVAREAYESADQSRRDGKPADAIARLAPALALLDSIRAGDLSVNSRVQVAEWQSRLGGLRDRCQGEIDRPAGTAARDSIEPGVLNAKAIEPIELQFNEDVYRHIRFFSGAGRSTFERWLKRSGRYMDLFRDVLQKEGLPPDLVHLVFVESGFNVHARSVSAAVGPWQFLRSTGRMFGLTVNQWVDERKDPEKATVAAARYLRHLYTIFGDWPLALASYNAGEGTVLRAIKRQGTTNYWDLRLPKQTEEYVPQFMAVLAITREPEKYGFDFDAVQLEDPMNFDELALKGHVDLRALAKLADCTYEELKQLNPAVVGHAATATKDGITTVRVPRGKADEVLSKLEGGVPMPAVDLTVKHRVRRNETLRGIAAQYHVDPTRLAKANGISASRPLKRGMVLTIRSSLKPSTLQPADVPRNDPRVSTAYVPPRDIRTPAQLDGESDPEGRATITVRRGQTLGAIAAKYGVTTAQLMKWNRLASSKVRPGQRLKVRTPDAAAESLERAQQDSVTVAKLVPPKARAKKGAASGRTVIVRAGDTLGAIAARNGTTVAKLKSVNGLRSSVIRTGQRLRLPG